MKKFKIVVKGFYGVKNFGDDALMMVIDNFLRRFFSPEDIAYIVKPNNYTKKLVETNNFLSENENYFCDYYLLGGGTQFFSFYEKKIYEKLFNKHIFMKITKYIRSRYTKSFAKKYLALGIGLGPFLPIGKSKTEKRTKEFLRKFQLVYVRDLFSYQICKKWCLSNCKVFADLCFSMSNENFDKINYRTYNDKFNVAIILRDWNYSLTSEIMVKQSAKLFSLLEDKGYHVRFILFSKETDIICNKLLTRFKFNILTWSPEIMNVNDFINQLADFDLFITARYHGAVFASLLNKPFIGISIEQKITLISDLFGMYKWDYPLDIGVIASMVNTIRNNYCYWVNKIVLNKNDQKLASNNMINEFEEFIISENIT